MTHEIKKSILELQMRKSDLLNQISEIDLMILFWKEELEYKEKQQSDDD